ncbi:thioredoxin family protein [Streptomyces lavendulocolor]|uniref:Thioredoxin family protein n=1 Tax=Streptomyces lavendulocolor TaxID=67316 RepID=A0ABV2W2B5_9ACTN|nr:thioredoxin [Streptomyces cellulosae]
MTAFPILRRDQLTAAMSVPGLVLLDFWQASCAPCRALEPRLEHFAQRHLGEFTGYRINVDTDQTTTADFDVLSIPTLILLRERREVARLDGLIRDADLEKVLGENRDSSA